MSAFSNSAFRVSGTLNFMFAKQTFHFGEAETSRRRSRHFIRSSFLTNNRFFEFRVSRQRNTELHVCKANASLWRSRNFTPTKSALHSFFPLLPVMDRCEIALHAGIYADDGISGTGSQKRAALQRLLAGCLPTHHFECVDCLDFLLFLTNQFDN